MPNQFTNPWTDNELKFLFDNFTKLSYKEIGDKLNRSYSSIQSKIRNRKIHKRISKHSINSSFFSTWSREMAYVLGFITADGNLQHIKSGYHLHIACDDYDVIEKIRAVMISSTPIREKLRFNGKVSYSLRFSDKTIYNDLIQLGLTPQKSLTIKPPIVPSQFYWDYIRGFFDGDGCVSVYSHNHPSKLNTLFYTGSYKFADFLYNSLTPYLPNYKGTIKAKKGKNNYILHFGQKHSEILFQYMYNNATIFMSRKYQTFLRGMQHES